MPKPSTNCACGCGTKTKSQFAPGHDARLVATLSTAVAGGGMTEAAAEKAMQDLKASLALQSKLKYSIERKRTAAERKANAAEVKRQKKAKGSDVAEAVANGAVKIKIGRGTYLATDVGDGDLEYKDNKGVVRRIAREKVKVVGEA
jgi:hypothetical protein